MTTDSFTETELGPPDLERPYWRDVAGERISFQEVIAAARSEEDAIEAATRHAQAICALAHAAGQARVQGEHQVARRRAFEAKA